MDYKIVSCAGLHLPTHAFNAFPVKPGLHWQLKLPGVLTQTALDPHLSAVSHSLISTSMNYKHYCRETLYPPINKSLKHNYSPTQPADTSSGLKVQPSSQIQ